MAVNLLQISHPDSWLVCLPIKDLVKRSSMVLLSVSGIRETSPRTAQDEVVPENSDEGDCPNFSKLGIALPFIEQTSYWRCGKARKRAS